MERSTRNIEPRLGVRRTDSAAISRLLSQCGQALLLWVLCYECRWNPKLRSWLMLMPNTDILLSYKLCDLVDNILPSAFGTTILKQKKDRNQVLKSKTQLESSRERHELNVGWMLSPGLRAAIHSTARCQRLPGKYWSYLGSCFASCWCPLPATKKYRAEVKSEWKAGFVPVT